MIYVSNGVGKTDNSTLTGFSDHICMALYAVYYRMGKIQTLAVLFEDFRYANALQIMLEPVRTNVIEHLFAAVSERGVPEIVSECDSLGQIFVEPHAASYGSRDLRDLKCVGQARPVVVADGRQKDLSLSFQAAKRVAVKDPVAVALKFGAVRTLFLKSFALCAGFVKARTGVFAENGGFCDLGLFPYGHKNLPLSAVL